MNWTESDLPNGPRVSAMLSRLGAALRELGYTVEALGNLLQISGELSASAADLVVYQRRLEASPGPLAQLIALFALGFPVPTHDVRAILGDAAWTALVESGSVREHSDAVTATIRLMPHGNLLVASDRRPALDAPPEPLHVTGINAPAGLLAALTVRRGVARALDLGTGNGIQALLAAHHAEQVIATDVNPRALAFAAYNAALNNVANIEFRLGNIFEPVAGEQFDLIVCNPPYVISPDADYAYRDSGISPAALCREIVGQLPDYLAEGGYGTVLVSWPSIPDHEWAAVPQSWLSPNALAWLLHYRAEDPLTHAASWNKPLAEVDVDAYAAAIDRWLAFDRQQQIAQISFGAVVLHRRAGRSGVVRCDQLRIGHGSASDQIERVFAAHEILTADNGSVLDRRFRLVPGHRMDQSLAFTDGEWRAGPTTLSLIEGIGFEGTLDAMMAQVLLGLDGATTSRQAADAASAGLAEPDRAVLQSLTEQMVSQLYGIGLLEEP
jgi:methyltransferase family protein